ncbi:hypothetical protein, conserved [Babesia bigemina]|uniref:Uncharacterized protein n=1 Tax=Babesia bigemina TaxID=5866 RepID=A0A061DEA3_BABBI|nr:hypothetical protein, conserved [Babesia bigemina]CDR96970.1 hypothetical protein, conserved [Babesia bigemina]|eukprot:XP_012769156.1 hypothetical protein, conserved [Babesia bigemina]
MAIESFIGSRISITTNSDLRYEGLLFDLNSEDAVIVLQNVQCMGTENRTSNVIPPSNRIHDYMVFKGEDIKDLGVCELKKEHPPEYGTFNDPAIQGIYFNNHFGQPGGPGPGPMYGPRDGPGGQGFGVMPPPPPPPMMGGPMMHPMGSPMYMPPGRGMYMGPPNMPGPMMMPPMGRPMGAPPMHDGSFGGPECRQPPSSPYWHEPGSFYGGMPTGMPHRDIMHPGSADKRLPGPMFMDSSPPHQPEADSGRFDLGEFDFGPDPFAEGDALGREESNSPAPLPDSGRPDPLDVEKREEELPTSEPHQLMTPTKREHKGPPSVKNFNIIKAEQLLASLGAADVKEDVGPSQTKPNALVADVKQGKPEKAAAVAPKEEKDLRPFYDKKSSFFDNLSSDIHGDKKMLRKERQKQHEINVDTFGADSVRRTQNNRGRGRGDRRGGGERKRRDSWNNERGERGNANKGSSGAKASEKAKAPEADVPAPAPAAEE